MKKLALFLTANLIAGIILAQSSGIMSNQSNLAKTYTSTKVSSTNLFSKSARIIKTVDFHAENHGYSTGVITDGPEAHGQTADYSFWKRWPNADDTTLQNCAAFYSTLATNYFGDTNFVSYMQRYLDTATSSAENGWMMLSLYDQRTPHTGNFNAYIQIDSIDASTTDQLSVELYQYYRQYYDQCYIDYCLDGINWVETPINCSMEDVSYSGDIWGLYTYRISLPSTGYNNVSIRLRIKSPDSNHGAYGYYWIVDDVTISIPPEYEIIPYAQSYIEGNYAQIPQGLEIYPAWKSTVKNTGRYAIDSLTATIYHLNATKDSTSTIATFNNGGASVLDNKDIICDPAGWLDIDSLRISGWYGYYDSTRTNGIGTTLPTSEVGDNYIFARVSAGDYNLDYDTMFYQVNGADSNSNYTWAHDNGVLTYLPYNSWIFGYAERNGNWFYSDDPDEVHFYSPGYTVTSRYTTSKTIPQDWVIKGVELVASPTEGYYDLGAQLSAVLLKDQYAGNTVDLVELASGANTKTITESDINDTSIISRYNNGFLTSGYNTIFIPFLNQPELEPNTSYRIGYRMKSEAYFALANEAVGYYRVASPTRPDTYDTLIYFKDNEATAKYAHQFEPTMYQNYFEDPGSGYTGARGGFAFNYDSPSYQANPRIIQNQNPMIRMIVGPRAETDHVNIHVLCSGDGDYNVIYNGEDVCASTITPALGASITLTAHSSTTLALSVDGHPITSISESVNGDPNFIIEHSAESNIKTYKYTLDSLSEDHSVDFVFIMEGINPIANNVRLNLQPNPATDQVNLNIEGISGMVNCTLADMSGRVVYNQNINAETAQVINLSNLAKGAYFVRITNDEFCKVEKLIIR